MSVGITQAQACRVALLIAQHGAMLWLEPTDRRDFVAVREAGASAPFAFVDADGVEYSRLPMRVVE